MLSSIFKYEYNGMLFDAIGQPIVSNSSGLVERFEILSRNEAITNMECFFYNMKHSDTVNIICQQVHACLYNLPKTWVGENKYIHVNIDEACLADPVFLSSIENTNGFKFAFEIDQCDTYRGDAFLDTFKMIQLLGHEIWLDDFGIRDKNIDTLLMYPWSGVKIDKSILWKSNARQIKSIVDLCALYIGPVVLEGVEDEFLHRVAFSSGAGFSQGFFWPLINN
ncbi:MAG: EAL domain-containing protein [Plesiomonas shigelloides]